MKEKDLLPCPLCGKQPILTGKDAQKFDEEIKANESKKVSLEEYEKAMESYRRFEVVEPKN